jgi:ferric-dicitrate binding protein FerR (iron transport regulator)
MADETRIAELITRHIRQTLSPSDKKELDAWLATSPKHQRFFELRITPEAIAENILNLNDFDKEAFEEELWARIRNSAPQTPQPQTKRIVWITVVSIITAAAAIVAWLFLRPPSLPAQRDFTPYHDFIWNSQSPAMRKKVSRPTLTLSDYSLYLDSLPIGRLAWLGNWLILKRDTHYIAYVRMRSSESSADSTYNIIAIPKGDANWKVSLPDGSIVGLSPGSSVAYVVHLAGASPYARLAVLHGQALIRASRSEQTPLYLETSKSEITVHGTVFSVHDYADDNTANTLLYSGSLIVSNGWKHLTLDSAQEATIEANKEDIGIATAASLPDQEIIQQGSFDFSNMQLDSALTKLARWYGIAHVYVGHSLYTDTLKRLSLGHISKELTLSQLLEQLQKTTNTMRFTANMDSIGVYKQKYSGLDQIAIPSDHDH